MNVSIKKPEYLGIPMMFPVTWEENIAANMHEIPALELFPGLMVSDLYKAYRAGLDAGKIVQWDPNNPKDETVGYISDTTEKPANVVRDFLDAMVLTIESGKAPASVLVAKEPTGIGEKTAAAASSTVQAVKIPITGLAVIAVAGMLLYGMSIGLLPKPGKLIKKRS